MGSSSNPVFSGCTNIKTVTIGNDVTTIPEYAFKGCTGITTVNFNATNCTTMGSSSNPIFSGCSSLKTLTIGNNVTNIPAYAFKNCSKITSTLTIPNAVTTIGAQAFYSCTGLTGTLTIPNFITSIGAQAFYGCSKLTGNLTFPNFITSIENQAFYNCASLTSVSISTSVTSIGTQAFYGCTKLAEVNCESVTPPSASSNSFSTYGTTTLQVPLSSSQLYKKDAVWGQFATILDDFWYEEQPDGLLYKDGWCIGYKGAQPTGTITIKEGTVGIREGAFANCTGITGINLPASVVEIEKNAFYNTGWWNSQEDGIVYMGSWCLGYKGSKPTAALSIKNGTQRIANAAFSACNGLTEVNFPTTLVAVGKEAFSGCTGLTKANITGTMATWCNVAFANATANPLCYAKHLYVNNNEVTSVVIPAGITAINAYAFYNGASITSVVIPQNVNSIGEYAFYGCAALGNISLPAITTIEPYTFSGCTTLTSMSIPEGVTSIGRGAFNGCTGITAFTLPSSLTTIGNDAFRNCSNLATLTLPNAVTEIGNAAFYGCSSMSACTLGNSVETIGGRAFQGCSKLAAIAIPNTTTFVGDSAFYGCSLLAQATLSSALTSIQPYTFYNCSTLGSINIPAQVESIGQYAFYGCSGLATLTLSTALTTIGNHAFYGCSSLAKLSIPNAVTTIRKYAFAECSGINQLTLGSAVADIADYAFYNCSNIMLVSFPAATQSIGMRCFANCTRLMSVNFANAETKIGKEAFDNTGWYNLQADGLIYLNNRCLGYKGAEPTGVLTIKDGTISIAHAAFANCAEITTINLPASLVTIDDSVFTNCSKLAIQSLPANLTNIGEYAFKGCADIFYLPIPNSVNRIGKYAFANCSGISDLTISTGITTLEPGVFEGCTSLYSVSIPNTVTKIDQRAFYGCSGLALLTIGTAVESIEASAFQGCTSLASLSIPNSVKVIRANAFNGCTTLASITIPATVDTLGARAFYNCTLASSIAIGNGVKSIETETFYGCSNATTITIGSNVNNIEKDAFTNTGWYTAQANGLLYLDNWCLGYKGDKPTGVLSIQENTKGFSNYAFENCTGITSLTMPTSMLYIGRHAFSGCDQITALSFPASVKSIGNNAFYGLNNLTILNADGNIADWCSINFGNQYSNPVYYTRSLYLNYAIQTDLVLPANLSEITPFAFYGCSNLSSITCQSTTPPVTDEATTFSHYNADLYVPNTSVAAYKNDNTWKKFNMKTEAATYTITANANNSNYGTVSGSGVYDYNATATLTATPNTGYKFTQWNDGNTQNPRSITVTDNATYTATFAAITYTITANANNSNYGTVSGAGVYNYNVSVTLTATPKTGYAFTQWNDGNTQNPRTITVTEDATYTATFAINTYNIAVNTNNSNYGTVSGAGTYNHNATATLTATANTGYKFVQWNDGNTQNPRSITVTESATYTATFAINTYTITVNSSNNTMGSVSGSGTYNYNATATLTATPNSGYTFTQWNDGNTQNPRTITVTENATYIANFAVTYNVDIKPSNNTQGNVTGSGDFTQGAVVTITATPNNGYKFVSWNDGSTENPRTITVNGDISYVATFADENATTYVSNITSNDEGKGSVSGSGVYVDGQQITIVATPEAGYKFVSWNDGSTENPRTVTVDENISYEATFAEENASTYILTVTSANANMGNAIGSGTYVANQSITIYAIANNGYKFVQWNDGNTQNPRQITVTQNATYTATFEANTTTVSYTIVALSSNNTMGSVSGGGTFDENTTITITATPNNGYKFVNWSDGSTENPRSITVTGNATYTANFAVAGGATSTYTISVLSSNNTMGSVNGGGTFDENTTITITATPNQGYKFVSWNDGNTQNPRQITVTGNATYIANFAVSGGTASTYTISVLSSNNTMGSVNGSGTFEENTTITITATPNQGYKFVSWNDGNTQNPRQITVTGNATYIANFSSINDDETLYTVSATSSNEDMGIVTGSGQYAANASVTLYARPFAGYKFIAWSDGNTQNPRTITVTANVNLIAIFIEESDAIAEATGNNAQIFGGEKRIIINNAANATVAIYDVMGRTVVKEQRINSNNEVFAVPQTGIYIVRMGKAAKKVFVK